MTVKYPYHLATANISMKINFMKNYNIKFDNNLITGEDVDLCNKIRRLKRDIMIVKNIQVVHKDRIQLNSFLEHQKHWAKHHYYLRYKNNFFLKKKQHLFYLLFFIFYPLLSPFISLVATYYNMKALIKYKLSLISLSGIIYLIYIYKSFYTYMELFKDLKIKIFNFLSKNF